MENKETVEKVVKFAQSENKTKTFRLDYPISNDIRQVMDSEVFRDFTKYTLGRCYDSLVIPPQKGEIVTGLLIPLGDGLHFPIIDFYQFYFKARKEIAMHIPHYHDKHLKTSTMHESFIHRLSALLQIERIIFLDFRKILLQIKLFY